MYLYHIYSINKVKSLDSVITVIKFYLNICIDGIC